ncbi:hypothetical protein ABPG75_012274 [Micractinium tetrahymenae]
MAAASAVLSLPAVCAGPRRICPAPFKAGATPLRAVPLQQRSLAVVGPFVARPSLPPCRSGEGDQQPAAEQQQQQAGQQQQQQPPAAAPKPVDPSVAKGQRTAIITGAISIIFGVIYLGLVSFLDMRGGELLPPPPEAYLP